MSECGDQLNELADRMAIYLNCINRLHERSESSEQVKNILRLTENFCHLHEIKFPFDELARCDAPEVYLKADRFAVRFAAFIDEFRGGSHQWAGVKAYQTNEPSFSSLN